jgi:tetratricopeptide (TPR) repeat protein
MDLDLRGKTVMPAGACLMALLAAVALVPPPLLAQPAAAQQADRQALIQGLQAQYEVALIRERKMADDRETQMIGVLEARLRAARVQADAARGDARQAKVALVLARADYARLAAQVAGRDPGAQAEIAAYRAQAQTITAQASPEKLAALQRFADGDRTGAWPLLASIAAAEDAAPGATEAGRASNARQLAGLRDIMRAHGEATNADVLALYDKAAALDPTNFKTQIERARLARDLGDLARARAAAQQAVAVSSNEGERAVALTAIGEQAARQGDNAEATQDFDQALATLQRLAAGDPTPRTQNDIATALQDKGDLQATLTDFAGARGSYERALAIRQRLAAADPADAAKQDYVTSIFQRIGDLDVTLGDLAGAKTAWEQALAIRQRLSAADPTNTDLQYYASALLRRIGDLAFKQSDFVTARKDYEDVLAIRQRLSAANPASAQLRDAVALDYFDLGEVAFAQNDLSGAKAAYEQSLAIRRRLSAADPTDAPIQQLVLKVMTRLARLSESSVTWSDVAAQYRLIQSQGHLIPNDDKVLQALKAHGLADGL